jgi:lysine-N-methylase
MTIIDGRCPMWRQDGLCRIQAELGEEALCKTCREFPRLTHDYGDFVEMGLELSCPEAARIILSCPDPAAVTTEIPGGEEPEYDAEAMEVLLRTRETLRAILRDTTRPANEVLALALMYGYQAQSELDGAEIAPFDPEAALAEARSFAAEGNVGMMLEFFSGLEILTPDWTARLQTPAPKPWSADHLTIARYFADRYWLQAVSDYDLVSRVKLTVVSCLVIRTLGGEVVPTAQAYSKEIENSIDNIEALLDGAYTSPAFTDDKLLGLLLN